MRPAALAPLAIAALAGLTVFAAPARAQGVVSSAHAPFANFESGPLRPLVLAADGDHLFALNTPDARLEVWRIEDAGGTHLVAQDEIFVGLEPVALAQHPKDPNRLFVVDRLSDALVVIDLERGVVVATVQVGDEPQGLALAAGKVFVTTHRSAAASTPLESSAWVESALVVVDAEEPYPVLERVGLPAHQPRAVLARGERVWVAPLNSGNHTTVLSEAQAGALSLDPLDLDAHDQPFQANPALSEPRLSAGQFLSAFGVNGWRIPRTGRIVLDAEYPSLVPQLADEDLFAVDAATHALLPGAVRGLGTTLFDLAANPAADELWVVGTDAHNRTRFESRLRGQAFENRIAIVASGALQQALSLAPPLTARQHAQPVAIAFTDDPDQPLAVVACLGTSSLVALDARTRQVVAEVDTGALPSGLAVDPQRRMLWVFCRGSGEIRAHDLAAGLAPIPLGAAGLGQPLGYDPEPTSVRRGRAQLYDARASSGAGTDNFSCASCHVFGHTDFLAWDLGDPAGSLGYFFPDLLRGTLSFQGNVAAAPRTMLTHPLKGPMVTQSFRGLGADKASPLHWRGDRRFFQMFRGAFPGLLGGSGIDAARMQEYAAFVATLAFPPNPYEPKDRVYRGAAALGRDLFGMNPALPGKPYNPAVPGNVTCVSCHQGNFGEGDFSGSQTTANFDGESQLFNAAGLRGVYEKDDRSTTGFGLLHDGSVDGIAGFLGATLGGMVAFPALNAQERARVTEFVRAWDSGVHPLVGAQRTARPQESDLLEWLDLAQQEAHSGAVDLVGHGWIEAAFGPLRFGLQYLPDGSWRSASGRRVGDDSLRRLAQSGALELTFTVVPAGTGQRLGLDRDEDGLYDAQEHVQGCDPTRPDSDGDGFDDALEQRLGSDPRVANASLPADTRAPRVLAHEARMAFSTSATLEVVLDEPGTLVVELGTTSGGSELGQLGSGELRRRHELVLEGLPPASDLFYRVRALDGSGNEGLAEGGLRTAPRLVHVDSMTLQASGTGPYTLTATVRVLDQSGAPAVDAPVKAIWSGPAVSAASWFPSARTDAAGVASFTLAGWAPSGAATITFSPAYVGSTVASDPWFVGFGGQTPSFFYEQPANREHYRSLSVP